MLLLEEGTIAMWKKGVKTAVILILCFAVITVWSVEKWSQTVQGDLPSKTAVILHAINHNLVSLDTNITVPDFLTPDRSKEDGVTMERHDTTITTGGKNTEIPVRVYSYSDTENAPVIVYYHGGAFLKGYGSLDTHENVIRSLAARTGAVVISPAYRVAPEYEYPAAVKDSYNTLQWARRHAEQYGGNPDKIAVAGDSAGGNLAAVTAMKARDENGPDLFAQLLFYPLTTFRDVNFDSRTTYDSGYFLLSRQVMQKAREAYTPKQRMWDNPYTSPLHAQNVSNLPPAYIVTSEFDPLRDEGEKYGRKLHEAGIPVQTTRYQGAMHGFVSFFQIMKRGDHALAQSAAFLERASSGTIEDPDTYTVSKYDGPSGLTWLQNEAEALAIGAFLVGKSVYDRVMNK
ncbi:alpha/beta hydrolase [Salibacterium halotolerans]|uniref:Acetyl esterase n=1 Tax=Salibacterium halotolerans TaxID=1884432 RepID=A0A1I5QDH0_9BACI|nr:alpha/beta hydrolase [Salibacterium halotolerans]SFP44322.1 acetyl esterase [Salibacterium halotolerans]